MLFKLVNNGLWGCNLNVNGVEFREVVRRRNCRGFFCFINIRDSVFLKKKKVRFNYS